MKLNCGILVIVLVTAAVLSDCIAADSKANGAGTKGNDRVNKTVDPVKNPDASSIGKNDSNQQNKLDRGDQKVELKGNEELNSESKNEPEEKSLLPVRGKCGSSSNRCTDDIKALVACLRVPGNDSPAFSLLIQNMGKGFLNIKISAPDLVQLEKSQIELQENKDTEVKGYIKGVERDHLIVLSSGHGNCTLNFRDQFVGMKEVNDSSHSNNILNLTLAKGFLFSAALLLLVVLIFTSTKLGKKYFARKDPKYQKLDMELPVSHGSRLESIENEGWDNSWVDDWDDEESLPITPSISSKGMASRKFSKEGWKD